MKRPRDLGATEEPNWTRGHVHKVHQLGIGEDQAAVLFGRIRDNAAVVRPGNRYSSVVR